MDEDARKIAEVGFQLANDLSKQLITLSTGILALTITFTKDIIRVHSRAQFRILKSAWGSHLISIVFGIWTMMALTGTLMPTGVSSVEERLTFSSNVRIPAAVQVITFTIGMILIIIFGATSFKKPTQESSEQESDKSENSIEKEMVDNGTVRMK